MSNVHYNKMHPYSYAPSGCSSCPFEKWDIDFMHCRHTSIGGHGYIIVAVDYFTKWVEEIPIYAEDNKTTALFLFNHILARFGIPKAIVTDHGSHFQNKMMAQLSVKLRFLHDKSTPYQPQANCKVDATNKVLKTMLQRMVGKAKSNQHLQIFLILEAYSTTVKNSTGFTPFQLVYELEATLPIECDIPS